MKRIVFDPLYVKEKAKIKHHLPDTICVPLVFSSLGGHTPATIRQLPRGGAPKKSAAGVQPRTRRLPPERETHRLREQGRAGFPEEATIALRAVVVSAPTEP